METRKAKEVKLYEIGICLSCGISKNQTHLDEDHFYPRFLYKKPTDIEPSQNPFKTAVIRGSNRFRLCREEHVAIDAGKQEAFGGGDFKNLRPDKLVKFLRENYPVTRDHRYFDLQIRKMIETNMQFIDVVQNLNGEFTKELVIRYNDAGNEAVLFVQDLTNKLADFRLG